MRHISGTVKQMIMIFGTFVQNYDISRAFFSFLIFSKMKRTKGQKIAQDDKKNLPKMTKKICLLNFISQEPYII